MIMFFSWHANLPRHTNVREKLNGDPSLGGGVDLSHLFAMRRLYWRPRTAAHGCVWELPYTRQAEGGYHEERKDGRWFGSGSNPKPHRF